MLGRTFSAGSGYRYGFNGKELDKETSSTTTYDYGFRIYSPALGRFLSVDPLFKTYPWFTPYQYASNNPIFNIDIDGLEGLPAPLKKAMDDLEQGWNRTVQKTKDWFRDKKEGAKDATKKATNAVLDAEAIKDLTLTAVAIDSKVATYTEEDKKVQFETNANSTVAILLYEFAQGTGTAQHTFGYSSTNTNSFANKVVEGRVKDEVANKLYEGILKDAYSYQEHLASGEAYKFGLAFSPDDTKTIGESVQKHLNSNLAQFFIGGANVSVTPIDATSVDVTITNFTSRNSLMVHQGQNYDMEKDKTDNRTPLSTTSQTIRFRLTNLDQRRTTGTTTDPAQQQQNP